MTTQAIHRHSAQGASIVGARAVANRVVRKVAIFLVVLFSVTPIAIVIASSFTSTQSVGFPPDGFSFRWYRDFIATTQLTDALMLSFGLAFVTGVVVVALSTMAAFALVRYPVPLAGAVQSFLLSPLFVPRVLLGLGLLVIFNQLEVVAGMPRLLLAHLIITVPFAMRLCLTALMGLPSGVEEAAASLGASRFTTLRRVTLPIMKPGLLAAFMMSFILSFDEVPVSVFVSSPGDTTFPALLYSYASERTTPMLYAASAVLLLVSAAVIIVIHRRVGVDRAFLGTTEEHNN